MSGFPGYRQLLGPEQLTIGPYLRVRTPDDYLRWQVVVVGLRNGEVWDSPAPAGPAYVNEGRWVATCHWCQKGMLTRPDWGIACCGECGARYRRGQVAFPVDHAAIVRALLRRPMRETQHWGVPPQAPHLHWQTASELERENREELGL